MTRESSKQTRTGRDEIPETIKMFPGSGEPIEMTASAEAKQKNPRRQKMKIEEPAGPLPDEAHPASQPPKVAQLDAAKTFMAATSKSQAFAVATEGLLGAVRLDLPGADTFFRTKAIEEIVNPDGTKIYLNQAIVSLYRLPDGARMSPSEPRLWLVSDSLVPAFVERKAKVRDHQLRLGVDRQGTPYLIPVPLEARDIWGSSLRVVIQQSDTKWLKMFSDAKRGRLYELGDDQTLVPSFPVEDFATIYMLALMPVFIDSKEHEIYKRICGA